MQYHKRGGECTRLDHPLKHEPSVRIVENTDKRPPCIPGNDEALKLVQKSCESNMRERF